MSLKDHEVKRDHFVFESREDFTLDFPCCVCLHEFVPQNREPCLTCDHNDHAVKENAE